MTTSEANKTIWGYSHSENVDLVSGKCFSREAAIIEAANELELEDGEVFFLWSGVEPSPARFVPDADDVIEQMGERAYEEIGEAAEDFPEATDEAKNELRDLLGAWAVKHFTPCRFWECTGLPEKLTWTAPGATT
jgi:hypothetical protein